MVCYYSCIKNALLKIGYPKLWFSLGITTTIYCILFNYEALVFCMESSDHSKLCYQVKAAAKLTGAIVTEDSDAKIMTIIGSLHANIDFCNLVAVDISSKFVGIGDAIITTHGTTLCSEIQKGLKRAFMHPAFIVIDAKKDLMSMASLTHKSKIVGATISYLGDSLSLRFKTSRFYSIFIW